MSDGAISTLVLFTPLYVQFEMIQAMRASGAEKVYIPTNAETGLPMVAQVGG